MFALIYKHDLFYKANLLCKNVEFFKRGVKKEIFTFSKVLITRLIPLNEKFLHLY